jgi:hypothetical protein
VALSNVKHICQNVGAGGVRHGYSLGWRTRRFADLTCSTAVSTIPPCFKNLCPTALINGSAAFYAEILKHAYHMLWPPRNIVASG